MTNDHTPKRFRPARRLLAALAAAALLGAAQSPARAADDAPRARAAGHDRETGDGHAVRRAVAPFAVRLAVDRQAVHPLSGPVAVREDRHLGGPGLPLRLIALAPTPQHDTRPEPAARAVAASPAVPPAKAAPVAEAKAAPPPPAKPSREIAVKITTPPAPLAPAVPVTAAAPPAAGPGGSLLVTGDSLSLFLADALRPLLAGRPGVHFAAKGKVSSGLARPDFFNWEREMAAASTANRPDGVVIMIATNDNQTLTRPDGGKVAFGRPGWDAEYGRRVRRLVELARLGNPKARIYWIGAPVMADARLNADVASINAVIAREIAALPGCRFVDVRRTLADAGGHYAKALPAPGGPRPVRTADGVHLTPYGAKLLAHAALAAMSPTVASLEKP